MTAQTEKIKVILIDDNPADNFIHSRVVERSGKGSILKTFTMATDALDWLATNDIPVDIIFLDINMPAMDGYEFLEHYNQLDQTKKAEVIVVMLTSSLNQKDMARAVEFGVDFNHKPMTETMFLDCLSKHNLI